MTQDNLRESNKNIISTLVVLEYLCIKKQYLFIVNLFYRKNILNIHVALI